MGKSVTGRTRSARKQKGPPSSTPASEPRLDGDFGSRGSVASEMPVGGDGRYTAMSFASSRQLDLDNTPYLATEDVHSMMSGDIDASRGSVVDFGFGPQDGTARMRDQLDRKTAENARLKREVENGRKRIARLQAAADEANERAENAQNLCQQQADELDDMRRKLVTAGWGRSEGTCLDAKTIFKDVVEAAEMPVARLRWLSQLKKKLHEKFEIQEVEFQPVAVMQSRLESEFVDTAEAALRNYDVAQHQRDKLPEAPRVQPSTAFRVQVQPRPPRRESGDDGDNATGGRASVDSGAPQAALGGGASGTLSVHAGGGGRASRAGTDRRSAVSAESSEEDGGGGHRGKAKTNAPDAASFDDEVCYRFAAAEGVFVTLVEALQTKLSHMVTVDEAVHKDPMETVRTMLEEEVQKLQNDFTKRERLIAERWWTHAKTEYQMRTEISAKYDALLEHCRALEEKIGEMRVITNALCTHNKQLLDELTAAQLKDLEPSHARHCAACRSRMLFTEVASSYAHTKTLTHIMPTPPDGRKSTVHNPHQNITAAVSASSSNPALGSYAGSAVARVLKRKPAAAADAIGPQ